MASRFSKKVFKTFNDENPPKESGPSSSDLVGGGQGGAVFGRRSLTPFEQEMKKRQNALESGKNNFINTALAPINATAPPIAAIGGPATELSLQNLIRILMQEGQTDPRMFNRQIVGAERGTESQIAGALSRASASGPGIAQSGPMQALLAAIGQGGENRIAGIQANEAQLAEQRRRDDILKIIPFLNIGVAQGQLGTQSRLSKKARKQQSKQNNLAALGELAKIGAGFFNQGGATTGTGDINSSPGSTGFGFDTGSGGIFV